MPKVFEDFLDLDSFAAEVNRHPRTIRRWLDEPGGLPYTKVGGRVLIHVPTARDWMLNRMHNTPPKARKQR